MSSNHLVRNTFLGILAVAVIFSGMKVIANKRNKPNTTKTAAQIQKDKGMPVDTALVTVGSIDDTIPVTGDVTALDSVILSPKIAGKLAAVYVREGDKVSMGQVVAQLDQTSAQASVSQAQAGLESALARLSQARTNASVTGVQSSASIQQAQAALIAAQANLQKIKKGARNQELMIAKNSVATAKANLSNADANFKRYKSLFKQGAIAQAQLDVAQTSYDVAEAQYNTATQNLSLVEEGARGEDVRAAETQVRQAEEALRMAKANSGQNALRQEDIKTAQAGVSQAQAILTVANQQLADTTIRSTIDGYVSRRIAQPGQTVAIGAAVVEVVNVQSVFFLATISETSIAKIKPGQSVTVKVDAYPDKSFEGKVEKIYPSALIKTRNFSVRISVPNPGGELRPGMFARGSVVTGSISSALLVSKDAVEERNGNNVVFLVKDDNTVKMVTINKGMTNAIFVEAVSPTNLRAGDKIVTSGHEYLDDGSKVDLKK